MTDDKLDWKTLKEKMGESDTGPGVFVPDDPNYRVSMCKHGLPVTVKISKDMQDDIFLDLLTAFDEIPVFQELLGDDEE
jgi:hypothetical protein